MDALLPALWRLITQVEWFAGNLHPGQALLWAFSLTLLGPLPLACIGAWRRYRPDANESSSVARACADRGGVAVCVLAGAQHQMEQVLSTLRAVEELGTLVRERRLFAEDAQLLDSQALASWRAQGWECVKYQGQGLRSTDLRLIQAPWILTLEPGIIPPYNLLIVLLAHIQEDTAVIAPHLRPEEQAPIWAAGYADLRALIAGGFPEPYLGRSCALWRAQAVAAVGAWDALHGSDLDLCLRLQRARWQQQRVRVSEVVQPWQAQPLWQQVSEWALILPGLVKRHVHRVAQHPATRRSLVRLVSRAGLHLGTAALRCTVVVMCALGGPLHCFLSLGVWVLLETALGYGCLRLHGLSLRTPLRSTLVLSLLHLRSLFLAVAALVLVAWRLRLRT